MPHALAPGVLLAQRYRLTQLLGEGGMGAVWAATHTVTRRQVAIKLPRREVRADVRRRFFREAMAMAAVDHPNVVRVYDAFELDDGTPIMVMDLLRGETFGSLLEREQPLSLEKTLGILLPVISAAGTAHAHGIVHRDLKPDNVFLADDEGRMVVKVLDFGIAKLDAGSGAITTTGSALGTPCYMAPEQMLGERDLDHRVDVWAIGVMLYEALAGGRPLEGEGVGQIVRKLLTDAIAPIGTVVPSLPSDVRSLIDRMLARERAERTADLREALATLSKHSGVQVPTFGAPQSRSFPSEPAEPVVEVVRGADRPITTNAPETLRSAPPDPVSTPRTRLRVGAMVVGFVILAAVFIAWPKSDRREARPDATGAPASEAAIMASPVPPPEPPVTAATVVPVASALPADGLVNGRSSPADGLMNGRSSPANEVSPIASAPAAGTLSKTKRRATGAPSASATSERAAASAPRASEAPAASAPQKRGLAEDVPF